MCLPVVDLNVVSLPQPRDRFFKVFSMMVIKYRHEFITIVLRPRIGLTKRGLSFPQIVRISPLVIDYDYDL